MGRRDKRLRMIPPPPGLEEGYDAIIAYFQKYSIEDLEEAGHLTEPSPREVQALAASAEYQWLCEKGLHVQLSRKDYERLARLAAREDMRSETLVKRWIKERLQQQARAAKK